MFDQNPSINFSAKPTKRKEHKDMMGSKNSQFRGQNESISESVRKTLLCDDINYYRTKR